MTSSKFDYNYEELGQEIGKLVKEKQLAYGDSFGRSGNVLRELFPNGINPTQYDDVLTIARILDKLFRIATSPDAFGESPYFDVGGYAILGYGRNKKRRAVDNSTRRRSKKPPSKRKCAQGIKRKISRKRR